MEVWIPTQIPDLVIHKLIVKELESLFLALNEAHGKCLNEENTTWFFSENLEEEKQHLEDAIKGLDLIHGFMKREYVSLD